MSIVAVLKVEVGQVASKSSEVSRADGGVAVYMSGKDLVTRESKLISVSLSISGCASANSRFSLETELGII